MKRSSQRASVPTRRGFSSGVYLENLLAELNRAEISARIKQARTHAGLTQPELGEVLQVHWRTVQGWEGKVVPWDRLDEIARATGKTRDWLLHGDQAVTPDLRGEVAQLTERVDQILEIVLTLLDSAEPPSASKHP
jgi:transcriptional regulator with XRE-family HTH domain